jgi:glucans biosynthesis protein C
MSNVAAAHRQGEASLNGQSGLQSNTAPRVWFLDTLRYVLVLAVVILHAAEPQMTVDNDWAVDDPRITPLADQIVVFLDIMLMSVLFFVAGYFTLPTMTRRGVGGFWRRKCWSLIVPAVLVVLVLNPVWKYVYHLTRSWAAAETPMSYLEAWWLFLNGIRWFEIGNIHSFDYTLLHVWFISVLLVFFALVSLYVASRKTDGRWQAAPSAQPPTPRSTVMLLIGVHLLAWVWAAVTICFLSTPLQWIAIGPLLLFQPANLPQYVAYFGLGLFAYRRSWFARSNLFGPIWYWLVLFLVAVIAYQSWVQYLIFHPALMEAQLVTIAVWFLRYCACLSSLVLLLTFGLRYGNSPHRVHQHLAKHSISFYLLHPAVVAVVQLGFLLWTDLDWATTLIGTCAVSLVATYAVSVLVTTAVDRLQQVSFRRNQDIDASPATEPAG